MEASGPSGNRSVPPKQRMAEIIGTAIAVLTLTIPLVTIAYFSSHQNIDTMPRTIYSLTNIRK
jgi:hypothetical protein